MATTCQVVGYVKSVDGKPVSGAIVTVDYGSVAHVGTASTGFYTYGLIGIGSTVKLTVTHKNYQKQVFPPFVARAVPGIYIINVTLFP